MIIWFPNVPSYVFEYIVPEHTEYKLGFDYDEENSTASELVFSGEYIDDQYEVDLYIDKDNGEYVTLKNFNVFMS